jgi:hypothetical protein
MRKRGRVSLSLRERLEASHRTSSFYALALDKPAPPMPAMLAKMGPKRERKPASERVGPSEHQEQCAVIEWWWRVHPKYGLPPFALFAVPNGAHLASGYIGAGKLKREGMRRGALDLILAKPAQNFSGLFIEMKAGDNKPSEDQKLFIAYLTEAGYKAGVHWSAESAIAEIVGYLGEPS